MSLNIKTASGLQRIAGSTVILDATTSEVRSGTFSLSGGSGVRSQDITFTTPMPDTDYIINIETTEVTNAGQAPYWIANKTVNGFRLSVYNSSTATMTYTGTYYAIRLVELEGYTEVQNKVDNPDSSPTENSTNLVTSGGVYEAIQNATKVFIGTEQEWEDETDKTKFQLAVLTDRTQINAVDETTGDTEVVADKTKRFTGTQAEWEALTSEEKSEYEIVCLTDDGETGGEDNYSTSEIKTNKKWINGEPIYQKTITGVSVNLSWYSTNYSYGDIDIPIQDTEAIISAFGLTDNNDLYWLNVSKTRTTGKWTLYSFVGASTTATALTTLTFQYTKTTD